MSDSDITDDMDNRSRVQKLSSMLDDGDDGDEVAELLTGGDSEGDADEDTPETVEHTVSIDMDDRIGIYDEQRHRNGDVTVVLLAGFGDGWQALALDIDAGGQLLATEEIGAAEDDARAASMCEYWLDSNPDGVLGSSEGGATSVLDMLGLGGGT